MRGPSYPALVFKRHRNFAIFSALIAAVLQYLIVKAVTSMEADSPASLILSQLPERFRMMVNETLISRLTAEGAAAFGFNHPIVVILAAVNAVSVPGRHLSGDIESGAMEWLLSCPVTRLRLFLSVTATAAAINFLVVLGAFLGSLAAVALANTWTPHLGLRIAEIALNLWLLSLVVTALASLASAWAAPGARPALWSAVVVLTLYVAHFLAPLWGFLHVTVPFNMFTYYQPQKLMFGESSLAVNSLVLIALSLVLFGAAARRFHTRDIPG